MFLQNSNLCPWPIHGLIKLPKNNWIKLKLDSRTFNTKAQVRSLGVLIVSYPQRLQSKRQQIKTELKRDNIYSVITIITLYFSLCCPWLISKSYSRVKHSWSNCLWTHLSNSIKIISWWKNSRWKLKLGHLLIFIICFKRTQSSTNEHR